MPDQVLIITDRLVIRRFEPSDGPGLYSYLSRPEAVAFEPYPVQSLEQCETEARRRAVDPDFFAVCLARTGDLVGNLYFHAEPPFDQGRYELGYVFHPDRWGHGYATEAVSALLATAFGQWGVRLVTAHCDPENTASWRLLERVGFTRVELLRGAASFTTDASGAPVWHDAYRYELAGGGAASSS